MQDEHVYLAEKIRIFSHGFCIAQAINLSFYVTSALISVTTHVIANGITTSTFEKHNSLPQSFGDRTCQENSMRCCCIIRRSRCRPIQLEKKPKQRKVSAGKPICESSLILNSSWAPKATEWTPGEFTIFPVFSHRLLVREIYYKLFRIRKIGYTLGLRSFKYHTLSIKVGK